MKTTENTTDKFLNYPDDVSVQFSPVLADPLQATQTNEDTPIMPKTEIVHHGCVATPGPWTVDVSLPGIVEIRDSEKRMLATVYAPDYTNHPVTDEEAEANARLIALAPELLSALEDAVQNCGCSVQQIGDGHHLTCFAPRAIEVIRKAKGEL